jgi:pimeloyl-ACP methyl ester carboxylesterase
VVLAGQSWGGWISLVVARDHLGLRPAPDALMLMAPTTWGPRLRITGAPNPNFPKSVSQLRHLLETVRIPIVAAFFANAPLIALSDELAMRRWDLQQTCEMVVIGTVEIRPPRRQYPGMVGQSMEVLSDAIFACDASQCFSVASTLLRLRR